MAICPTLDGRWWCWEIHISCWIVRLWEMMICPDDFIFVRKTHVMGDLDDGLDVGRSVWSCYRSSFPTASPWILSTQKAQWRGTVVTVMEEICQQAGPRRGCHLMKLKCWLLRAKKGREVGYDLGFDPLQIQQLRAVNLCLSPHPDDTALYDKAD